MPLYDYHCRACGYRFERIQKFSDPLVHTCPNCNKDEVEQLISAPAVQFKGSGWYVTDYSKKNSAGTAPHKSESTSSSSGTSESAPAASTETKTESK